MDRYLLDAFQELYTTDGLTIMAPGIGIKQLFMKFVKAYCLDTPPQESAAAEGDSPPQARLVFCLNASGQEGAIRSALLSDGVPFARLPVNINNKVSQAARTAMYSQGGCYFTTARVMIVDLLTERVDAKSICGMLVFDGDRVGEVTMEAFILKLYKRNNPNGFIKAFSDAPDAFGTLQQLERSLKTLQVSRLYLYPRFHGAIARSLALNQPEVIEMSLDLSEPMRKVQDAILVALEACLAELRRALPHHDASLFTLQNGMFSSFDRTLRQLLDPEYHRLSWRTKQLVTDCATIRRLLECLTRYDAVTFYHQLLNLRGADGKAGGPGSAPALWMTTVAGERIFQYSRERVFTEEPVPDVNEEGAADDSAPMSLARRLKLRNKFSLVLEVPPKWDLLKDILSDIRSTYLSEDSTVSEVTAVSLRKPEPGRVLLIVKDDYAARQISEYISSLSYDYDADTYSCVPGSSGGSSTVNGVQLQPAMLAKMKIFVTRECDRIRRRLKGSSGGVSTLSVESQMFLCLEEELYSAADSGKEDIGDASGGGRDLQGYFGGATISTASTGSSSAAANTTSTTSAKTDGPSKKRQRTSRSADDDARFIGMRCVDVDSKAVSVLEHPNNAALTKSGGSNNSTGIGATCGQFVGKSRMHVMVLTHSQVRQRFNCFAELLPSHVVVLDASLLTIRQLEVYAADTANEVKVFFTMYDKSVEEQRYEASIAREKKAFESLIGHKAHMVIQKDVTAEVEGQYTMSQRERDQYQNPYALAPIDSRSSAHASTGASAAKGVIVDVREFRSALPFTLYNAGLKVIPVTLQVGDYILSPEICVERKGISDLFQSFNSGRLYSQAESMLKHYKNVCLLIEFSADKAFSLQATSEITSDIQINSITSKMCLLIMAFPALKILWSKNPVVTTSIFKEIKKNFDDVDLARAMAAGTATDAVSGEEDSAQGEGGASGGGVSAEEAVKAAIDMLKKMPGIDEANVRRVVGAINCVADLANMSQEQLTPLVGPVNTKKLFNFLRATF